MDRFVLGGSNRKAPTTKSQQAVTLKKTSRKRNTSKSTTTQKKKTLVSSKQDVAESDKENQKEITGTINVHSPLPDDLEDIGSQLVVWKDDSSVANSPRTMSRMEMMKDGTTCIRKQPQQPQTMESYTTRNSGHETAQDLGFSSPELFQFWKRYGVSRLNIKRKKSRQWREEIGDEDLNISKLENTSDTLASNSLSLREETISSLLDDCEELAPDVVLSLEEWFRKYEQQVGPAEASSERLRVVKIMEENGTKLLYLNQVIDECKSLYALLCDEWYNTAVYPGDIVRIVQIDSNNVFQSFPKNFSNDLQIRIDQHQNFLIVQPDKLISATCLSNSFTCMRRAVLADWNRFAGVDSLSALQGAMIHSLVEAGLVFVSKENLEDENRNGSRIAALYSTLVQEANRIVDSQLENLYGLSEDDQDLRALLQAFVPQIVRWLEYNIMRPDSRSSSMECYGMGHRKTCHVRMLKADSVEETIWSPILGLKGKIDAIFQIETETNQRQQVPFELKTVHEHPLSTPSIAHRAQLLLYSLMLSDRNDQSCDKGLLSYFVRESKKNSQQQTVLIASIRAELVGLLMTRNKLVRYDNSLEPDSVFPPLLKQSERICQKCSVSSTCMMLHKLVENGSEDTTRDGPGLELFTRHTRHLTQNHSRYFQRWFHILCKEERLAQQTREEIWTLTSEERERQGNCFSCLIVVPQKETKENSVAYENQAENCVFQRKDSSKGRSFLGSNIVLGDYVIVSARLSNNQRKVGVARGFVTRLSEDRVELQLDSNLNDNSTRQFLSRAAEWRIDKDEMLSGWAIVKTNLQSLFLTQENEECSKLRSLVVDLEPPRLDRQLSIDFASYDVFTQLNEEQQAGILKAFQSLDYMLVHGMPGTGKTAWIVALVEIAVLQGLTVLLCGHTHASVDNVLLRLKQRKNISFLRLGRHDLVHHGIWDHCLYSPNRPKPKTVKEWKQILESPRVVATTCMGISHVVFSKITFDLVVVDEAGQIAEPVCLGPLRMAKGRFILVGDPFQLAPLMRASKWNDCVESLFERLCVEHPEAVVTLCKQYRMANDIMQLSNQLIYSHKLQCANEEVANRCLALSSDKTCLHSYPEWLRTCIDSQSRVVFVDTDELPAREQCNQQPYYDDYTDGKELDGTREEPIMHSSPLHNSTIHWNPQEAAIVVKIVEALHCCGLPLEDIGIISPYRAQCSYIHHQLAPWKSKLLEIKTVDQFQGRDKPCILFSFVRSNDEKKVGPLLRDWKRLNVAFTRAQSKCIFVGSLSTLKEGSPFLAKFTNILLQNDWVVHVRQETNAS